MSQEANPPSGVPAVMLLGEPPRTSTGQSRIMNGPVVTALGHAGLRIDAPGVRLLAEADVSYEKLLEMEQANEEFPSTDVVLILGANDVVNPAAKSDPASPIYGMPILEVEQAKTVIVNKRSMKPGYAGIENDLFFRPKTSMLFGDAKKVLQDLIGEIKNL